MNYINFLVVLLTLLFWGVGCVFSKLAADRIGTKSIFWDLLGYLPAVLIYCLVVFRLRALFLEKDRLGVGFAVLAGALGSVGTVAFYFLLSRAASSLVVPLTSLYPAVTVVLAFVFLHESINLTKLVGILLSLTAIYLLTR